MNKSMFPPSGATRAVIAVIWLLSWCSSSYGIETNGLVFHYTFEGVAGTNVTDESGNGRDGILRGGAVVGAGVSGDGLWLDGTNGLLEVSNSEGLNLQSNFTLSAWVKDWASTGPGPIVNKTDELVQSTRSTEFSYVQTNISCYFWDSSTRFFAGTVRTNLGDGAWHQLVLQHDAALPVHQMRIFIDGHEAGVEYGYETISSIPVVRSVAAPWRVGRTRIPEGTEYFASGCVDEVAVYSRKLDAEEIWLLYESQVSAGTKRRVVIGGAPGRHGAPQVLGYGTNYVAMGTVVTNCVGSPVSGGVGVRYVCEGWNGTGDVPASGSGTSVVFTVTTNSTLTWNWRTEYWLEARASGNGSVDVASGWRTSGESVTVTATPSVAWGFAQWVIVGSPSSTANPLSVTMAQAQDFTAVFTNGTGLLLHYSFDHDAGTNVVDDSGSGNGGVVVDAVHTNAGPNGTAMYLDGNGDYIRMPGDFDFPVWPSYSVGIWFLNDGGGDHTGYGQKLIDKLAPNHDFYIRVGTESDGRLSVGTTENGALGALDDTSHNYMDSIWHHAVLVRSGTNGSLWVDGVLMQTGGLVSPTNSTVPLIGYSASTDANHKRYWSGMVDDVRVYDRALTADDVSQLYSESLTGVKRLVVAGQPARCGSPVPQGYGTNYVAMGTVVTNCVGSPVSGGVGVRYVCKGWNGTGDVPASGSGTSVVFTVTTNSTLTWKWRTEYWLDAGASGNGSVDVASGWFTSGNSVSIQATPGANARFFGWGGDTNGAIIDGSTITVTMDAAKSVTANFGLFLDVQAVGTDGSVKRVPVGVTPSDYSNKATGTTPLGLCYGEGTVVHLSVPGTLTGGWRMIGWTGVDTQNGTNGTVTVLSNTMVRALYDSPLAIAVTNPTSYASCVTTGRIMNLGGTASSANCPIARVEVSNDRGGGGVCTGTTQWRYDGLVLYNGVNRITATVYDTFGHSASDTLTVKYWSRHASLQNLVLLGGAVVRQIHMADNLVPGTTNTVQWQVEAYEPVLSGLKIRLPNGGGVTNVTLNGVLVGAANGAAILGDWRSVVYSFQADWVVPNELGTCRIRFLTARQDGYAYVNASIPHGTDTRPFGPDGKEIARDITGVGSTPVIQSEPLTMVAKRFETLAQALSRRGSVVQSFQLGDNLTPGSLATSRWSVLTYPGVKSRIRVDLPVEADLLGTGARRATTSARWRLPASGRIVEYDGSLANDSVQRTGKSLAAKVYDFQSIWRVPNDPGTCTICIEVSVGALTNWMGSVLPDGVDGRLVDADIYTMERDIAGPVVLPVELVMGITNAAGNLSYPGDADWYQFSVAVPGTYRVQTYLGTLTDTIMKLYGPDSQDTLLDQNDNAIGKASRITRAFGVGTYFVKITAPLPKAGTYRIVVSP